MSRITTTFHDDVALVTFDDGKRNVVNHEVLDELEAAWDEAEARAKAIVLAGRDGSFCAGYDIRVMTGDDGAAARELGRRGGRFARRLYASPRPLLAASAGHSFTIGVLWMACCDVRVAERGAHKYAMTETALNVPFSPWPLEPLKARLAPSQQIPAILHSQVYDPAGALDAGFVDLLVDPGAAVAEALARAAKLAELPGAAYAASKLELRRASLAIMDADLD
jgi:enoyl-CoA hydratase